MRRIEKQFTYPIWDEWRTNSFTQGRTGTHTYKGPEFITVEVNKDPDHENYGKESGWCLTRKEEFEIKSLGHTVLKGKSRQMELYSVMESKNPEGVL